MTPNEKRACVKCNGTFIYLEESNHYYARADYCTCFPSPCPECSGLHYVLMKDHLLRELATPCTACGLIRERIKLYNASRILNKHVHSRMTPTSIQTTNPRIFYQLHAILKNLEHHYLAENQTGSHDALKGIILIGASGIGKANLMSGFAYRCVIEYGVSCVFQRFGNLLKELAEGYGAGKSDYDIIAPHLKSGVLIIDDLGTVHSEWALSILDMLVTERYNRNQIFLISVSLTETEIKNLQEHAEDEETKKKIAEELMLQRIGNRIYSRLREMCYVELV